MQALVQVLFKYRRLLAFAAILSIFAIGQNFGIAQEHELLKSQDVTKIMQQIFDQHVTQKEMTGSVLKKSFKIYLEQFDPERIYLYQGDIDPILNPTESEITVDMSDYQKADFTPYRDIDAAIQKSIVRARQWRQEWESNPAALFQELTDFKGPAKRDEISQRDFANSLDELKRRAHQDLIDYLHYEIAQFGEPTVRQKTTQVLSRYEADMRGKENQYLYKDEESKPLTANEKEHLFTLHVLKALAKSLDSHTAFFNSSEAYDMRVRLEKGYDGIGIVFKEGIDGVYVSNLVDDGPAAKSKQVKVGDQLVSIDGKPIQNEPFLAVMDLIRGDEGSSIQLVLRRKNEVGKDPGQLISVALKREKIVVSDNRVEVNSETFGDGIIGRITLHAFYQSSDGISSEKDVRDAIAKLKEQGKLRGLILDLRENSGGYLSQAVKVAGLFITNGVIVISKYSDGDERFYRDLDSRVAFDGPLVILTSRMTASAAEIVAQALQDYGVALVVGDERTYGKGSIQSQTVTNSNSTSYFKVTVGKYYTVSGHTPQATGVKADIVVPGPLSQDHLGEEYLEYPLSPDTISASFQDTLSDVQADTRGWYMKYYLPSLQHKKEIWKQMTSALKKNSEYRMEHNKNFQTFLRHLKGLPDEPVDDELDQLANQDKVKNFGSGDLQLEEAYNIVKDMVMLQSSSAHEYVGQQE